MHAHPPTVVLGRPLLGALDSGSLPQVSLLLACHKIVTWRHSRDRDSPHITHSSVWARWPRVKADMPQRCAEVRKWHGAEAGASLAPDACVKLPHAGGQELHYRVVRTYSGVQPPRLRIFLVMGILTPSDEWALFVDALIAEGCQAEVRCARVFFHSHRGCDLPPPPSRRRCVCLTTEGSGHHWYHIAPPSTLRVSWLAMQVHCWTTWAGLGATCI